MNMWLILTALAQRQSSKSFNKCFWVETSWNKLQIIFFSLSLRLLLKTWIKREHSLDEHATLFWHTQNFRLNRKETQFGINRVWIAAKIKQSTPTKEEQDESKYEGMKEKKKHTMTTSKDLVKVNSKTIFTANIDSMCLLLFSPTIWCKTNQQWMNLTLMTTLELK